MTTKSGKGPNDAKPLFVKSASDYGESYANHLLEQYKLYVESALRVTQWRNSMNSFLLAANTLFVTLYGFVLSKQDHPCCFAVPIAGVLVCFAWWFLIQSHKRLSAAKFKVIHQLESRLPARLFDHEWDILVGEKKYKNVTWAESWIPVVFGLVYLVQFSFAIWLFVRA